MGSSESKVEPRVEPTIILDYLPEECWRAVLDYVPLRDIIRSEGVSLQWQAAVLEYLAHSRIGILPPRFHDPGTHRNVHMLELKEPDWPSFEKWSKKSGPSVVSICMQPTKKKLKIIRKYCPNLETIMFITLPKEVVLFAHRNEKLKHLRRICFGSFCNMSDSMMVPFFTNDTLEELELNFHNRLVKMTGQWLLDIKKPNKKFKSLIVTSTLFPIPGNFVSVANYFNLTRLELMSISQDEYNGINMVLEKLPGLETLCFTVYRGLGIETDDAFFKSVSRLSRLKHLKTNVVATDKDVREVTSCCEQLDVLMLENCTGSTGRGLAAAWRSAGARLTALCLRNCDQMSDGMLVAAVTACHQLKLLDVDVKLTEDLLPRLAEARRVGGARRVLRLRTSAKPIRSSDWSNSDDEWDIEDLERDYPELKISFGVYFNRYYDWTTGETYGIFIDVIQRYVCPLTSPSNITMTGPQENLLVAGKIDF